MAKVQDKLNMVVANAEGVAKAAGAKAKAKMVMVENEVVKLIGSETEKAGSHIIHMGQGITVKFQNGEAEVEKKMADELRKLGLVK